MTTDQITEADVQAFLKTRVAAETEISPDQISINAPLSNYRLDSVVTVTLAVDLEEWLNCPIDPSVFWEFSTIAELATWLVTDYLPNQRL